MGLISKTLIFGAGLACGYMLWHTGVDNLQSVYRSEIGKKVTGIEEKYSAMNTQGIVGANDLSIDYVISESEGIKGLMFTDNKNGEQGVLVKRPVLFQTGDHLEYVPVGHRMNSLTEKVPVFGKDLQQEYVLENHPGQGKGAEWLEKTLDSARDYARDKGLPF